MCVCRGWGCGGGKIGDHFDRTNQVGHASAAKELLEPITTRVDVLQLVTMLLSAESPRKHINFVKTGGKVVLSLSHDGVELTPSKNVVLGFASLRNLWELRTSPFAAVPIWVGTHKEHPEEYRLATIATSLVGVKTIPWPCPNAGNMGDNQVACPACEYQALFDAGSSELPMGSVPIKLEGGVHEATFVLASVVDNKTGVAHAGCSGMTCLEAGTRITADINKALFARAAKGEQDLCPRAPQGKFAQAAKTHDDAEGRWKEGGGRGTGSNPRSMRHTGRPTSPSSAPPA